MDIFIRYLFHLIEPKVDLRDANERDLCTTNKSRPMLRIASLSGSRVNNGSSGCLEWRPMHDPLRRVLEPHFCVHMQCGDQLDDSLLQGTHLLILNMCGARVALSQDEKTSLQRWVRDDGGVALLNCFSNWSHNDCFNSDVVDWLGIDCPPTLEFSEPERHSIDVADLVDTHTALTEPLAGPHGKVITFENLGCTPFSYKPEQNDAPHWICDKLAYFGAPFGYNSSSVGRGAALVFSNFHWMCGSDAWEGGVLEDGTSNSNAILLRNIATRAARVFPWSKQRHAAVSNAVHSTVVTVLLVGQRIKQSKRTNKPHPLPALPSNIWLHILEQSNICELEPHQEPTYRDWSNLYGSISRSS